MNSCSVIARMNVSGGLLKIGKFGPKCGSGISVKVPLRGHAIRRVRKGTTIVVGARKHQIREDKKVISASYGYVQMHVNSLRRDCGAQLRGHSDVVNAMRRDSQLIRSWRQPSSANACGGRKKGRHSALLLFPQKRVEARPIMVLHGRVHIAYIFGLHGT